MVRRAPTFEEDMAMSNIALDLIGQARLWLTAASQAEGAGVLRTTWPTNGSTRLAQPTLGGAAKRRLWQDDSRQYFFDAYHLLMLEGLSRGSDGEIPGDRR
ncbi:MAG: hypothetical protein Ct9H300mP14_05420 [Gammaproteobacteria bacterium]|nr:MAG: hypothetical protein Ct9H300mP14_05420 [Gammaproteobacteria bacterium]